MPTDPIPEETGEPVDVEAAFESDEFGIKVTATLGEAAVVVEHSWDAAESAATLVQALPQILIRVEEALQAQQEEQ